MKSIKKGISRRCFCTKTSLTAAGLWCGIRNIEVTFSDTGCRENKMSKKISAVEVKVIKQTGHCDAGHKVGDTARFTENSVDGKICIHALYSMMSGVFAMFYDAKFPWLKDSDVKTHACPDWQNPVVFEIKKIRK